MVIFGNRRSIKDVEKITKDFSSDLVWAIGTMCQSFDIRFVWYNMVGYRILRRWCGTDVLKCRLYWHYRLRAWLCNLFIDGHCFVSEQLRQEFFEIFPKAKLVEELWPSPVDPYERKFNVMVYLPKSRRTKKLLDYIYGMSIYSELSRKYKEWNWLVLYGKIPKNIVLELYHRADVLLRMNLHDGAPRMVAEAKMIGLPVIWNPEKMSVKYAEGKLLEIYNQWEQNPPAMI